MGLHYFHGGADPEEVASLADGATFDHDPPDDIQDIVDAAEENGYGIKGVLLEDLPDG
ncbi:MULTISPECIES: hypothetical protein [unclassified Halorubrum]|uniref:hypothetical protein n=1 Tax=unclassified Halorubrum TaxID=2642239 RepID=UPI0013051A49|nr:MULTISPECIES: hypothetical protein [unclassified Halorubrum]